MTANVFDSFRQVRTTVLISEWTTQTTTQLVITCLGLFVASIIYPFIRKGRMMLTTSLAQQRKRQVMEKCSTPDEQDRLVSTEYHLAALPPPPRVCPPWLEYMAWAFVTLFENVYGLLILLTLMAFNPWIFMSVVVGYTTGELIVCYQSQIKR